MWWYTLTQGGEVKGNWRMESVASTLHTTSEHGVSSITTAYAHTSAASKRLNWRPGQFKGTRPFRRKTKSGFCACAITFQLASTLNNNISDRSYSVEWKYEVCKWYGETGWGKSRVWCNVPETDRGIERKSKKKSVRGSERSPHSWIRKLENMASCYSSNNNIVGTMEMA